MSAPPTSPRSGRSGRTHLRVNNVSLGVYAEIVERDGYRDAKVETTLDVLPDLLGNVTMAEIIAAAATRRLNQTGALASTECTEIEVRSRSGTALVGVDGVALKTETPLEFRIHAGGLRLLVPPGTIEAAHDRATGSVTFEPIVEGRSGNLGLSPPDAVDQGSASVNAGPNRWSDASVSRASMPTVTGREMRSATTGP